MTAQTTSLEIAKVYIGRGWNPLPVPHRSKVPPDTGWQNRVIDLACVHSHFNGREQNIGVVLGPSSQGLTDLDLDCDEAIALAPITLQKTSAIFGRVTKPASHWLYQTSLADTAGKATIEFRDPTRAIAKVMLLEVRVGGPKGAQTIFPGSTHESGEAIVWDEAGEPATAESADLLRRASLLASCCLFARYWPGQCVSHSTP